MAASLFSPVAAFTGIQIAKVTTNGDTTTIFVFDTSGGLALSSFQLVSPQAEQFTGVSAGVYTVTEEAAPGWVPPKVECVGTINVGDVSTFTYLSNGVTVDYVEGDQVVCTFTNSPIAPRPTEAPPVGGVVMPANTFAIAAPWLAIVGLVGCIGTVAVVAKKREK